MIRLRLVLILLAAGSTVAVMPALAADQTVTATPSNQFTPVTVTVSQGEKVTWTNAGSDHNVKFDDGSFEQPANPNSSQWTVSRTFISPGSFRYYCEEHGGPGGAGMSGTVRVQTAGPTPGGSLLPPFSFAAVKANKRQGTARLIANVPAPGDLDLAETNEVKGAAARADAAGQVQLPIRPKRKVKDKLNEHGKAKVGAKVTYAPDGGDPNTQTKALMLIKRG